MKKMTLLLLAVLLLGSMAHAQNNEFEYMGVRYSVVNAPDETGYGDVEAIGIADSPYWDEAQGKCALCFPVTNKEGDGFRIAGIRAGAFAGCDFSELLIEACANTLKSDGCIIGEKAFEGCKNLRSVRIWDRADNYVFSPYAFAGCSSLDSLKIVMCVGAFCEYAFTGCPLKYFALDAGSTLGLSLSLQAFDEETYQHCVFNPSGIWTGMGSHNGIVYGLAGTNWFNFSIIVGYNDNENGDIYIGIATPSADDQPLTYDLQGRPVAEPQHGIYIQNGKKVLKR